MRSLLQRLSGRLEYRLASAGLLLATLLIPLVVLWLGGPAWLAFAVGVFPYATLVWLTYYRLQDASLSSGWLILMVVVFHFGPKLDAPEPLQLHLAELLNLVPVVMGWLVPSRNKTFSTSKT